MSAAGISLDAGLTTSRSPIAEVLKAATDAAGRTIGMVDATKFGRPSLVSILPATELDLLISDAALPDDVAAAYRAAGVALTLAPG